MPKVAANADLYAEPRQNYFFPGVIPELDGQCVSLVKWFMQEMSDVPNPQAARGDARYVGKTLVAQGHAVEVAYADRKRGDIICYESGLYGHIAVQLSGGRVFEQNVNLGGVSRKLVDGSYVYASRIGFETESWRRDQHVYRLKTYKEGNNMNKEQATSGVQNAYLLSGEQFATQAQLDYHVPRVMADPGYLPALMHQLYLGKTWQTMAYLAGHYESDTKSQYNKGYAEGQAAGGGGGNLPVGTYLKVDKANIIEVK